MNTLFYKFTGNMNILQSRSALQQYAASVATRGIIHCNSSRSKHDCGGSGLGWRPLHKPQWYTANKTVSHTQDHSGSIGSSYVLYERY